MLRAFTALAAAIALWTPCRAQVAAGNERVRVVVGARGSGFNERYLANRGGEWIVVASAAGRSAGAVSVRAAGGAVVLGAAGVVNASGPCAIVERFTAGGHAVIRTIQVDRDSPWLRITTRLEPSGEARLYAFEDTFRFARAPDATWSPTVGGFNPDAQYKSPVVLVQSSELAFSLVPDVTALTRERLKVCQHALDLDVPAGPTLSVGFAPARMLYHSVYTRDQDRVWSAREPLEHTYFMFLTATAKPGEAHREAVRFLWERFGRPSQRRAATQQSGTGPYSGLALWDDWRPAVWERDSREGWLTLRFPSGAVGGGVRTLRWGQPKPSLYLSAWFNSMRTAFGMALHARRTKRTDLLAMARQTLTMATNAPGRDGAFKTIAVPGSGAADTLWAAGDGAGRSTEHGFLGFDMSWTAYWMLRWRAAGLEGGDGVLPRCRELARFLLARQAADGMLPSRFDSSGAEDKAASRLLMAETAPAALFLLELHSQEPRPEYLAGAIRALGFLDREVVPRRKWYDFETFFSCSPRVESLDARTGQYPANNLALIHAVAAYLAAYRVTGERAWLAKGEALLDYLLLYQQVWTNPVLEDLTGDTMLLGGFTTQNSDAEWSDARQSLCANVVLDYYRATGNPEYLERGVAALRAQFPVSPSENWAHVGYGKKAGVSSFHWGAGSGMAGVEIEEDFLRDAAVDLASCRGAGVNGLNLTACEIRGDRIRISLESPFEWRREAVVTFHGGTGGARGRYQVSVNGAAAGEFDGAALERGIPARPRTTR